MGEPGIQVLSDQGLELPPETESNLAPGTTSLEKR